MFFGWALSFEPRMRSWAPWGLAGLCFLFELLVVLAAAAYHAGPVKKASAFTPQSPASGSQDLILGSEGSAQPQDFIPRLIALWRAGRLPLERLVATYDLEAIDEAEADALAGRVIKPVLLPG